MEGAIVLAVAMLVVGALAAFWMMGRFRRRIMLHQERMLALEKGIELPALASGNGGDSAETRQYLLRGLIWLLVGIAVTMTLGALFATWTTHDDPEYRLMIMERTRDAMAKSGLPVAPWTSDQVRDLQTVHHVQVLPVGALFLGFIPIAVGLAYLIFYWLETRRLRAAPH